MLVLAAALTAVVASTPSALRTSAGVMRDWLSRAGADGSASGEGLRGDDLMSSALTLVRAWAPGVVVAAAAGIVVNLAQAGLVLAPKNSRPSLRELSVRRGLQQLSPAKAGYTLGRNVLKLGLVGLSLYGPLTTLWRRVPTRSGLGPVVGECGRAITAISVRIVIGAAIVAAIDQVVSRRRWRNDLMMTRQEVLDEAKSTEGDPHTKAARKRIGLEIRRRRSLAPVSLADVVITNPTHFAVALAYTAGAPAPQVIDKGTERAAQRIRRDAARHGVPIIEDKPLARALHRQVRVGGYVPERFFDAVVKVLVAAYWRRGRVPDHVAAPRGAA